MATPIYHITNVANLPGIVGRGELCSDTIRQRDKLQTVNIAYQHIKERRAKKPIKVGPRGMLSDYVPFYFAPRSPMLFAINGGFVDGYAGGQVDVVHLVSWVEEVDAAGLAWAFSDGHAEMALSKQFEHLADLSKLRWDYLDHLKTAFWNDTSDHPDRKRYRQAEFLVHHVFPWGLVSEVGVLNAHAKKAVDEVLNGGIHHPPVGIRKTWYY